MSIDSINSTIKRINTEISSIKTKVASKRKEESTAREKAMKAITSSQSAKTESSRKSKLSEYERENKKSIKLSKEIADLEKRLSEKEKNLIKEQEKLYKEQVNIDKKRQRELNKIQSKTSHQIANLNHEIKTVRSEQLKMNKPFPLLKVKIEEAYDVFISHASEDKKDFVDSLVKALIERDIKIWYDKNQIGWGDSIRQNIDEGLRLSKYGIVVLSESYMKKYWTQKEFNALFAKESIYGQSILPIWHNISKNQVMQFSSMLLDLHALNSAIMTVDEIADAFLEKINRDNE